MSKDTVSKKVCQIQEGLPKSDKLKVSDFLENFPKNPKLFATFADDDFTTRTATRTPGPIGSHQVVDNLGTIVPILPANEAQARPLTQLPAEQQAACHACGADQAGDRKAQASW